MVFYVIGIGGLACVLGGYISNRIGNYKVALWALIGSGVCCIVSPFILHGHNVWQIPFLFLWGMLVVMDSPQFSSLIAKFAPVENRGSALTIVTCIGFSITVISIIVLGMLVNIVGTTWLFWLLAPGPMFGVVALLGLTETKETV